MEIKQELETPSLDTGTPCRRLKRKSDEFYSQAVSTKRKCEAISPTAVVQSPSAQPTDQHHHSWTGTRCDREFFDCPCEDLARKLLGCALFRVSSGVLCSGRVVETEAYLGGADKAAHSYNGKRTERNEAMYMPPGTAYVYSIYGMHHCFNISSRGGGAAVLIRALEPLGGVVSMTERRKGMNHAKDLCNGPAKLCQALTINKTCNRADLVTSESLWVERPAEREAAEEEVVESGRIGVQYAGDEWASEPLRFHIKNSPFVSKK